MAANKQTIANVVFKIHAWQGEWQVSNQAVLELLENIAQTPGNQSFQQTTEKLVEEHVRTCPGLVRIK